MRKNIGLYRAKRKDNYEWVEGSLFVDPDLEKYIIQGFDYYIDEEGPQREYFSVEVIPESIGECTNLTDKKNNPVFEGDIVKFIHKGKPTSNKNVPGSIHFFSIGEPYSRNYEIKYVNTYVNYGLRFINGSIHFPCKQSTLLMYDCEIIGNIHDNPELLKGGTE